MLRWAIPTVAQGAVPSNQADTMTAALHTAECTLSVTANLLCCVCTHRSRTAWMPGWRARSSRRPRKSRFLTPGMPCSACAHHSLLPCRSAALGSRSVVPSPGQLLSVKHSRQLLSHTHRTQVTVSWRLQPASAVRARRCSAVSLFCSSRLSPRAVCWRKSTITPWFSSLSGRAVWRQRMVHYYS